MHYWSSVALKVTKIIAPYYGTYGLDMYKYLTSGGILLTLVQL